jgi:DNA polymerase III delta subunit
MVVLLCGPDDYRREQKRLELIKRFKEKFGTFGLGIFDFEDKDALKNFLDFMASQSMFSKAKLALLTNFFEVADKDSASAVKSILNDKNTTVIISEVSTKPPAVLSFILKSPSLVNKFDKLKGIEWINMVKSEARVRKLNFTNSAIAFLGESHESDSWRLATELDKLAMLQKATIDRVDLEEMGIETVPDFWALVNGLKSFNLNSRLSSLEKVFWQNEPAAKMFNIMAYMWKEKTSKFAYYDLAIKSGKMDYEEALLDAVL